MPNDAAAAVLAARDAVAISWRRLNSRSSLTKLILPCRAALAWMTLNNSGPRAAGMSRSVSERSTEKIAKFRFPSGLTNVATSFRTVCEIFTPQTAAHDINGLRGGEIS
jgi:hypothetical protein